jgi:hypothetical protein
MVQLAGIGSLADVDAEVQALMQLQREQEATNRQLTQILTNSAAQAVEIIQRGRQLGLESDRVGLEERRVAALEQLTAPRVGLITAQAGAVRGEEERKGELQPGRVREQFLSNELRELDFRFKQGANPELLRQLELGNIQREQAVTREEAEFQEFLQTQPVRMQALEDNLDALRARIENILTGTEAERARTEAERRKTEALFGPATPSQEVGPPAPGEEPSKLSVPEQAVNRAMERVSPELLQQISASRGVEVTAEDIQLDLIDIARGDIQAGRRPTAPRLLQEALAGDVNIQTLREQFSIESLRAKELGKRATAAATRAEREETRGLTVGDQLEDIFDDLRPGTVLGLTGPTSVEDAISAGGIALVKKAVDTLRKRAGPQFTPQEIDTGIEERLSPALRELARRRTVYIPELDAFGQVSRGASTKTGAVTLLDEEEEKALRELLTITTVSIAEFETADAQRVRGGKEKK